VAVAAGTRLFIVDAGTNGVRNLGLMRYPIGRIEAVFLTHYHSDHIDGLGELSTLRWIQGTHTSPLPVIGPIGVSDIVAGFNQSYARDAIYRNAHHGDKVAPLSGAGMVAKPLAVPEDGTSQIAFEDGELKVEMFSVDHKPVSPAVGYKFTYKKRTVLISGDTARSFNLEEFASNVDLLVHEALSPELVGILHNSAKLTGNDSMAKITTDILDYHATPREAAELARNSGAAHLLFYHIVPPLPIPGLDAAWLKGVEKIFPKHTLGQDGTIISMPANSRDVKVVSKGMSPLSQLRQIR
jgi:ribonuclease Z